MRLTPNRLTKLTVFLLLVGASPTAPAKNVGFSDISFFVKTKIIDGRKADDYELEFWWCQIGRDDLEKRECVPLSSCRYDNRALLAEVKKLKDGELREELELAVTSSYQTRLKSTKYLPELIRLLRAASEKKECVVVSQVEVHDDRKVTLKFDYPPLKHGR